MTERINKFIVLFCLLLVVLQTPSAASEVRIEVNENPRVALSDGCQSSSYSYVDDFSTTKAKMDSYSHSPFVDSLPDVFLFGVLMYMYGQALGFFEGYMVDSYAYLRYEFPLEAQLGIITGGWLTVDVLAQGYYPVLFLSKSYDGNIWIPIGTIGNSGYYYYDVSPETSCTSLFIEFRGSEVVLDNFSVFLTIHENGYIDTIVVDSGWQWVSIGVKPEFAPIESLLVDCWDCIDIVVACDGSFCTPGVGCWIDSFNVLEMYKVHMSCPCSLEIRGERVPVDTPIVLNEGWGCISYLPDCPLEPDFALASIWSCLNIVKNDAGEFCIPGVICTIDCMEPGEGYKVHMACVDTLIYPDSCPPCPPPFGKQAPYSEALTPTHFNYIRNTGESYSIVIDSISLDSENPTEGDEVGVFTSGGLCVGASVWEDQLPLALVAWKDDPQTTEIDGYILGDTMHFKFWDSSEVLEKGLKPLYSVGDGTFGYGSHSRLSLNVSASAVEDFSEEISYSSFLLSQNYPNPFNARTTISYFLPKGDRVTLMIYNIRGQRIRTLVEEYQTSGLKNIEWNGKNSKREEVSSGIYFYNIRAGDFIQTKKMVLLR